MTAVTDRDALKKKLREVLDSQEVSPDEAAPKTDSAACTSGQSPDDGNSAQAHSQAFVNIYGENVRSETVQEANVCSPVRKRSAANIAYRTVTTADWCRVMQARAKVEIKKESVRLNDVQQLLTWVLGDGMSPTWAFIRVRGYPTLPVGILPEYHFIR